MYLKYKLSVFSGDLNFFRRLGNLEQAKTDFFTKAFYLGHVRFKDHIKGAGFLIYLTKIIVHHQTLQKMN